MCASAHVSDCERERERETDCLEVKLEQEHYYTRNHRNQLITNVFNVNLYNTT